MSGERMIFTCDGRPLNAIFEVEGISPKFDVILHGRWKRTHNRDYLPALELILQRLACADAVLLDALVDTAYTRRHKLPPEKCRLPVRGRSYPIVLRSETDFHQLRLDLLHRIGTTGLPEGASGGHTPLKRIRLRVCLPGDQEDRDLADVLAFGARPPVR